MKHVAAVFALFTCLSMTARAAEMTGYVSDSECAVKSAKAAKATDWINPDAFEACAKKCAKAGSTTVFVTEDNKILRFDASSATKAAANLGHRVSVTGTVKDGVLTVDSITAIEMSHRAPTKGAAADDHSLHGGR